jgi:prepilin-type N-terminal cleavage/methylation domain-containing protein
MELLKKNKGFTLIEVVVAIFLITILLLGMLQGLIISKEIVYRNLLRDEAVKIANEFVDKYRNTNLKNIPSSYTTTVRRKIGNREFQFNVSLSSIDTAGGLVKELTITVEWNYKGKKYNYSIKTLVGNV